MSEAVTATLELESCLPEMPPVVSYNRGNNKVSEQPGHPIQENSSETTEHITTVEVIDGEARETGTQSQTQSYQA